MASTAGTTKQNDEKLELTQAQLADLVAASALSEQEVRQGFGQSKKPFSWTYYFF